MEKNPQAAAKVSESAEAGKKDELTDKERKEIQEAYRVAQELERQEEEEMIRKAIEESQKMEQ